MCMNVSKLATTTMRVLCLIFPFAIHRPVYSSPVPPNAIKSRVELPLLALLVTFVFLLLVLFSAKRLYMMRRCHAGGSRTDLPSGWYDNFSTSSSRFGTFFSGSGAKSGFLIGLLGSPTWETRYSAIILDRRSVLDESSVSSRRSISALSLASLGTRSCSAPCDRSRSPVPGEHTHIANDANPISLPPAWINRSPLLSDREYMRLLNARLSSTLPVCTTSINSGPYTTDSSRLCVRVPTASLRPSRGTIQRTCPHPVDNFTTNTPTSMSVIRTPSAIGVSLDHIDASLRVQRSFAEPESQNPSENFSILIPFPNAVKTFESPLTSIDEHSPNGFQSHSAAATSKYFTPSLRSKTIHPRKGFPSYRSDRSPKIGPSPLRTVTHSLDSCPDSFLTFSSNRHNHRLVPSPYDLDRTENLDFSRNVQQSSTLGWKKSTDADSLLELMSELAQETSAWDPNVFMDENFKKLISQPKLRALKDKTVRPRKHSWRSSRYRKVQHVFTALEDIPEVDVTEMMPASTGDAITHSFWSDVDDDHQFLIGETR